MTECAPACPDNHAALRYRDGGRDAVRTALLGRLEEALFHLFPAGCVRGRKFYIGDVRGRAGDSMNVDLAGEKIGLWNDFATGEGGDVFSLWACARGFDVRRDFPKLMDDITAWLGSSPKPQVRHASLPVLGPPSMTWDYLDAHGHLIARVHRFDTPKGKEFRPWDASSGRYRAPEPRPLYNQPGMAVEASVVLVEGEKCAQALINQGICATTAMNGANAPIEKTDWSPLDGKRVVIWPDNDPPGRGYAGRVAEYLRQRGLSVSIASVPDGKPRGWDCADAVAEGMDVRAIIAGVAALPFARGVDCHSLRAMLADTSAMPMDLIAPRVLTPGGLLVFGGAPKVGKSDFLLAWLVHMAAGVPFLGMTPPRPLRIFILQAEIQYDYLRERLRALCVDPAIVDAAMDNLVLTPQQKMILDEDAVDRVCQAITRKFPDQKPDILVIDPLRNVFDGGSVDAHENDNNAMLFFLQKRVEALRDRINPKAGIILVHHTSKISKRVLEEDPFRALSGAGSLRSYYTSGMLLYRPDESKSERQLYFELRNGAVLPFKTVDKKEGVWVELNLSPQRLVRDDYSQLLDAERRRKHDIILQIISDEARLGRVYTSGQFADVFENKKGLGGGRSIRNHLSVLASKGLVRFFQNGNDYGLPNPARTKFGYLCVEAMELRTSGGLKHVPPTHLKRSSDGASLCVEQPDLWTCNEEGEEP
ncbi:MAG: AAA family ATPase [Alphaproteobacteria bacterium]|nr:AAA family ATPase [Alphaproteobacteria bacterium]